MIGASMISIAIAFALDVGAVAREMPTAAPLGRWTTANRGGVIEIGWCGATLCGRIVGIARLPGEPIPTDYQGRSQCGLTIITDESPTRDGTWLGHITDPRSGKKYQAELWVDDAGRLKLRGFVAVPLLGETETWRRFTGRLTADCRVV
ncbi:MAG TPA: DUF2147 domain-containing protein [Acetobacteraceae bacterium]